jgi:SAM-dependent methyltransferase
MPMGFFVRDQGSLGPTVRAGIEWEEANCLLCDSPRWSVLVEAPDRNPAGSGLWFAVVQCQHCGLCYTNPRPSAHSIDHFYASDYRPHRLSRRRGRRPWWRRLSLGHKAPRKLRQVLPCPGRGRLLDFGCGGGNFLERMRGLGWQVTGVDTSPAAIQRVRTELGLDALAGSLPHVGLAQNVFDLVTMWQSLEHVHQPLRVLREARRLLVPGGMLVVSVPNIDSLPFRWFGTGWYGLDLPRHLTHFTPPTLHLMLEKAGFRVRSLELVRHSDWLRASAELASQLGQKVPWQRWLRTKTGSNLAAWYTYLTRQADCIQAVASPH